MAQKESDEGLGPLPQAGRTDELESLGINALRNVLPRDQFLFRDERIDDKGVDGSLEVLIQSHYTNLRAQVQLKSTDRADVNHDGSVSWSVSTSNLNYLLNGPSPIYVLYIAPRDELRFVWARFEERRLAQVTPDWKSQATVVLRFADILSSDRLSEIHGRIRKEAQAHRRFAENLSNATVGSEVIVAVDPDSLVVMNPEELREFIDSSGMAVVAAGYAKELLQRVGVLSAAARQEPRICLVCGYAEFMLGRYFTAFGQLGLVGCQESRLSEEDRSFYHMIRNACEFQLGRVTEKEYDEREQTLARNSSSLRRQRQVAELRAKLVGDMPLGERYKFLESFRKLVEEIVSAPDVNQALKLAARIELLESEGVVLIDEASFAIIVKGMRDDLALAFDTHQTVGRAAQLVQRMHAWVEAGNAIIDAAMQLAHPLLLGHHLFTSVHVRLGLLSQRRILAGVAEIPDSMTTNLMEHAEAALRVFRQSGAFERELRTSVLLADLHEFVGETGKAREILEDVLPKARAMDYARIISEAETRLAGQQSWNRIETQLSREADHQPGDWDRKLASQTDEEVKLFATLIFAAKELEQRGLPIVDGHLRCMRDAARERVFWCRYLTVEGEDPTFQEDPMRSCHCQKHGYKSNIHSADWTAVIGTFKTTYCSGCPDREPYSSSTRQLASDSSSSAP